MKQLHNCQGWKVTWQQCLGLLALVPQISNLVVSSNCLKKLHMPDVNEGANSVDYLKKVFCQTKGEEFEDIKHDCCHKCKKLFSGEEEECRATSCNG